MVPMNKGESGFQRLEVVCKKKCTRRGKIAEIIVLSQGKVNPILSSCFHELTSLQVSLFSRAGAPWKHCLLILFVRK